MRELYRTRPAPFEAYRCNPRRMGKYLRRIKLGPPPCFRWEAWQALLCLSGKGDQGQYQSLPYGSSYAMSGIRKDLERTFPEEPYFSSAGGLACLERVLGKLAGRFPTVGYCQSMNYIAGFLLLVSGGRESEVFNLMEVLLVDFNLQEFFSEDMRYLKQCLWIFNKLLAQKFPALSAHLSRLEVIEEVWVLKWFMTAFTVCFEREATVRVWDYFLVDKMKALYSVALGIIGSVEKKLLKLDAAGLCSFFKNVRGVFSDSEGLVRAAVNASVPYSDLRELETAYQMSAGTLDPFKVNTERRGKWREDLKKTLSGLDLVKLK